jgi:hypothetical protein
MHVKPGRPGMVTDCSACLAPGRARLHIAGSSRRLRHHEGSTSMGTEHKMADKIHHLAADAEDEMHDAGEHLEHGAEHLKHAAGKAGEHLKRSAEHVKHGHEHHDEDHEDLAH